MQQGRGTERDLKRYARRARRWKLGNRLFARFMFDPFGNRLDRPRALPTRVPHFYMTVEHLPNGYRFEKVMETRPKEYA